MKNKFQRIMGSISHYCCSFFLSGLMVLGCILLASFLFYIIFIFLIPTEWAMELRDVITDIEIKYLLEIIVTLLVFSIIMGIIEVSTKEDANYIYRDKNNKPRTSRHGNDSGSGFLTIPLAIFVFFIMVMAVAGIRESGSQTPRMRKSLDGINEGIDGVDKTLDEINETLKDKEE